MAKALAASAAIARVVLASMFAAPERKATPVGALPPLPPDEEAPASAEPRRTEPLDGYRPWAELLARTFALAQGQAPRSSIVPTAKGA